MLPDQIQCRLIVPLGDHAAARIAPRRRDVQDRSLAGRRYTLASVAASGGLGKEASFRDRAPLFPESGGDFRLRDFQQLAGQEDGRVTPRFVSTCGDGGRASLTSVLPVSRVP